MKTSQPMSVLVDVSLRDGTVQINPNDGFELGLMTTEYAGRLYVGPVSAVSDVPEGSCIPGTILLRNEVRPGTIELSSRTAGKLDGAKRAILTIADGDGDGDDGHDGRRTFLANPA